MRLEILGFRHTGLIVRDLETSLIFYRDLLGLEVIQIHKDSSLYMQEISGIKGLEAYYAKLRIPGGTVLELLNYPSHLVEKPRTEIHWTGEAHLALQVKSATESHQVLCETEFTPLSKPVLSSKGIAIVFFCQDPDGYRVEFVEMLDKQR
jgi:catechol 2,3-dioxygenase-like lactoylglutathione lyase family enzyme